MRRCTAKKGAALFFSVVDIMVSPLFSPTASVAEVGTVTSSDFPKIK